MGSFNKFVDLLADVTLVWWLGNLVHYFGLEMFGTFETSKFRPCLDFLHAGCLIHYDVVVLCSECLKVQI